MFTSTSHDSSSMNKERSADTEWMLSSPMIDNSMYDFLEELIPICNTDNQTYTYLADSSCLLGTIQNFTLPQVEAIEREGEISKSIMKGVQNNETENPAKHDLDGAISTPPLPEGFTCANARLSQNDKIGSPTKHDLDSASSTPPLPEDFTDASAGLSQNDKTESLTKHNLDAASATPPLSEGFTGVNDGLPHNDKTQCPTKHNQDAASATRPSVAVTQSKYVSARNVIIVETREDVAEKIISFAKGGPKSIFIRSATGKVTKVVLKRRPTSSEIETHEGLYNIVYLYGSYTLNEVQGQRCLIGGLHIFSAADGRASFSGRVAGAVIATSQVEVIVMSLAEVGKEES